MNSGLRKNTCAGKQLLGGVDKFIRNWLEIKELRHIDFLKMIIQILKLENIQHDPESKNASR